MQTVSERCKLCLRIEFGQLLFDRIKNKITCVLNITFELFCIISDRVGINCGFWSTIPFLVNPISHSDFCAAN